jgi:hypothetical protein
MMKNRWIPLFLMLVAGLAGVSSVSAGDLAEGLEVGPVQYYTLTDSPVSGPVEMFVSSNHPTASLGTFSEVFLLVQNHSNDATVSINIDLELVFADGQPVHPFNLGRDRLQTLGPDEGVGFFVYFSVPQDTELGKGTFGASARVTRVSGGNDGHRENPNPMVASDSVSFEVIP